MTSPLLGEFLGTMVLILLGNGVVAGVLLKGTKAEGSGWIVITAGWAFAVMAGVFTAIACGSSDAHLNPAVSLVAAARRELSWPDAAAYILVQLAFGIIGAWAAHLMFDLPTLQLSVKARNGLGQWTGEAIATFGLILTILGTVRHRPAAVPASVALYIVAAYWFTSSTSFANPAITIARSLSDTFAGIAPHDVPSFIVAQLAGAALGAVVATFLFARAPLRTPG